MAAIAASAQCVQVLSIGEGTNKAAALTAIAAARHQHRRILALPASDTAASF